jgi:hypothetical protein
MVRKESKREGRRRGEEGEACERGEEGEDEKRGRGKSAVRPHHVSVSLFPASRPGDCCATSLASSSPCAISLASPSPCAISLFSLKIRSAAPFPASPSPCATSPASLNLCAPFLASRFLAAFRLFNTLGPFLLATSPSSLLALQYLLN